MSRDKKKRRLPAEPETIQELPVEATESSGAPDAASSTPWWHSLIPFLVAAFLVGLVTWLFTGGALLGFLGPAAFITALYAPFHYLLERWLANRRKKAEAAGLSIPKPQSWVGQGMEMTMVIALALTVAFSIQTWLLKPYQIPSGSMEPTLDIGQRILVNRLAYEFNDPSIGDIVVFNPPANASASACGTMSKSPFSLGEPCPRALGTKSTETFIKRIVAGPGDTLSIKEGHPVVNGVEKTDEPYITPCEKNTGPGFCNLPKAITIPPDHYFMMGDNRGGSDDSRYWGPVPRSWIVGEAIATYWPPDRWGFF